jgi:hypothetical protein
MCLTTITSIEYISHQHEAPHQLTRHVGLCRQPNSRMSRGGAVARTDSACSTVRVSLTIFELVVSQHANVIIVLIAHRIEAVQKIAPLVAH